MLFGTFPALEYLVSTLECLSLQGPGKKQLQRNHRHLELLLPSTDSHYWIHQNTADPGMCLWSTQGNYLGKMTQYPTPRAVTEVEAYQTPNTRCLLCLNLWLKTAFPVQQISTLSCQGWLGWLWGRESKWNFGICHENGWLVLGREVLG